MDRISSIINTLNVVYKKNKFSGVVKIGLENSKCSSVIIQNETDVPMTKITEDFLPENYLNNLPNEYYGSVIYSLKNGEITEFAYTRNYRSDTAFNSFFSGK